MVMENLFAGFYMDQPNEGTLKNQCLLMENLNFSECPDY
jgi:hypothetical protein